MYNNFLSLVAVFSYNLTFFLNVFQVQRNSKYWWKVGIRKGRDSGTMFQKLVWHEQIVQPGLKQRTHLNVIVSHGEFWLINLNLGLRIFEYLMLDLIQECWNLIRYHPLECNLIGVLWPVIHFQCVFTYMQQRCQVLTFTTK